MLKHTASIPEAELSAIEIAAKGYHYSHEVEAGNRSLNDFVKDPYAMVEKGSIINNDKLIETFSTNTNTKSDLLKFCQKILNGEKLADLIKSDGELYTVTTDATGNAKRKHSSMRKNKFL